MANPVITSTTTRWVNTTTIGAKMSWTNGTKGYVELYLGSTVVKTFQEVSNGVEYTFSYTADQSNTYTVHYKVESTTTIAEKYETLFGDEPPFSLHPSGGAAFGKKAVAREFASVYPAIFNDVKVNGSIVTSEGYQGPLVGNGGVVRPNAPRGIVVPAPYITYDTLGISAGSSEAQVQTFITAWMKYMTANFPDSNEYAAWMGVCRPGIRCIVLWYPYDTSDLDASGTLPKYSIGLLIPFGNNESLYKFGTDNGTVYFNGNYS